MLLENVTTIYCIYLISYLTTNFVYNIKQLQIFQHEIPQVRKYIYDNFLNDKIKPIFLVMIHNYFICLFIT